MRYKISVVKASTFRDKLQCFLNSDPEFVQDVLLWWFEHRHVYPWLSRMAMDYLTIPGELLDTVFE